MTGISRGTLIAERLAAMSEQAFDDPPTSVLPSRRVDVFAVIQADARQCYLRVSRLLPDGTFRTLRQECDGFRGTGGAGGAPLDPRGVAIRLTEILSRYQRTAELYGAVLRAVATHAFRSLPNHVHLLRRLPRVTRVALELISDRDVARLICLGALRHRPPGHRTVVIDIGDQATSIILANAEQPLALWQVGIGAALAEPPAVATGAAAGRNPIAVWRKQVQQTLSLGHLAAIRGAAREAVLIWPPVAPVRPPQQAHAGPPGQAPEQVPDARAFALVDEVASYLAISKVETTPSGLHEGISLELARALAAAPPSSPPPSETRPERTPPPRTA